jgi:parallel beta-helix repeat protein
MLSFLGWSREASPAKAPAAVTVPARTASVTPSKCTHLPQRDVLRPVYRQLVVCGLRTVYVNASTGKDSNPGTEAQPYATITKAVAQAQPGDRVLVSDGVYGYLSVYGFQGRADAWLSIEAAPDSLPVIDVANAAHTTGNGIDVQKSSFVGTFGFEVHANACQRNVDSSGIGVFQGSHHVLSWAHHVHDFPGGGINHFYYETGWDVVDASFNTIHDCCKYSAYNTSGISFYGAEDTTKSTWDDGYAYRAVGNYLFSCICLVPYTAGGMDFITDGNGISVDSLHTPNSLYPQLKPYDKLGGVHSNVVVGCGGRGIHVYNSINCYLAFNTCVGNVRTNSPAITASADVDATYDKAPAQPNVHYYGCLLIPLNSPNSTVSTATYERCVITGGTQAVSADNIDHRTVGAAYVVGKPSVSDLIAGLDPLKLKPTVIDPIDALSSTVTPYTALGLGKRPATGKWAAGALEA